jgi:tetratricopeptide (TPR) repeat protein
MKVVVALVCGLLLAAGASAETFLILPFSNLSSSQNLDWLGESMAESIRDALASQGLLALGRDDREEIYRRLAIRPYKPMTKATAIRIGESLDAGQVIFGSFDLTPEPGAAIGRGTLRIRTQVIELKKARRGPEFTEIGALDDLARLQRHLAWQTLKYVSPDSAPDEDAFAARNPIVRVDAIESYTRGLLVSSADQKVRLFLQAVRLDPKYSQAHFQLGKAYWAKHDYRNAAAELGKVADADTRHNEASFYLGLARYMSGDYAGAQQTLQSLAAVIPLNEVFNNLGAAQSRRNSPEALDNFRKALDGDPADPDYHFNVGLSLYKQGKFDEAAARFRAVLERNTEDKEATTMLGRCLQRSPGRKTGPLTDASPERLKETFEESAYLQLKAVLEKKR